MTKTANERLLELERLLDAGSATVKDMSEIVDLLAITGTTLTGTIPERVKKIVRH
jgi:hypothetical protein